MRSPWPSSTRTSPPWASAAGRRLPPRNAPLTPPMASGFDADDRGWVRRRDRDASQGDHLGFVLAPTEAIAPPLVAPAPLLTGPAGVEQGEPQYGVHAVHGCSHDSAGRPRRSSRPRRHPGRCAGAGAAPAPAQLDGQGPVFDGGYGSPPTAQGTGGRIGVGGSRGRCAGGLQGCIVGGGAPTRGRSGRARCPGGAVSQTWRPGASSADLTEP